MFRLIVGLGNDGPSYHNTFHNVGFRVLDLLAARRHWDWRERKMYHAADGPGLLLAKPRSFMNTCGPHVKEALLKAGGEISGLLVVVDDFMLPEGKLRLRREGSSGGHNGLKSLFAALGTEAVPRLRVGVGPVPPGMDPADYVLKRVSSSRLESVADKAAAAAELCLSDGLDKAMNVVNGQPG